MSVPFKISVSLGVCAMLAYPSLGQGGHPLDKVPAKYDRNANGVLDAGKEEDVYFLHQRNPSLEKFDADFDGTLNATELQAFQLWAQRYLDDDREDAHEYRADHGGIVTVAMPSPNIPIAESETEITSTGFLIRQAYAATSILAENPTTDPKSLLSVKPATGSYTRDNASDSDQYAFSGSLFGYRRWSYRGEKKGFGGAEAAAISAGIEFDRSVSSAPGGSEANALTLRSDFDLAFQNWPIFDTHFVTGSLGVTSDFDLDTALLTAGFQWQPVHNSLAMGVAHRIGGAPLSFRWQPVLSAQYQHVADAGDQMQIVENEDYLFVGPSVSAQLFFDFEPLNGAFLDIDYIYRSAVSGAADDFDYFEASANFPLDENNHFLLNFRYREGELPTTRQKVDDFLIGIGVRY